MNVVCINDQWRGGKEVVNPIKNEIYTVVKIVENHKIRHVVFEGVFFILKGLNGLYSASHFRPVDNSFGEQVCEDIEQELELIKE